MALNILYQDQGLIAIDKPQGLLVHRSRVAASVREAAVQRLRDQIGQSVYLLHRLDRATSGVLLFARTKSWAKVYSELFRQRRIKKVYWALVRGYTEQHGEIEHALKEPYDRTTDPAAAKEKAPQDAMTRYRLLARVECPVAVRPYNSSRYSLVECFPETGRKHQIRRHFKHIFHPIIGDTTYGDGHHNRALRQRLAMQRLWLRAMRLEFIHPRTHERIIIRAPVNEEWQQMFESFGWLEPRHPTHLGDRPKSLARFGLTPSRRLKRQSL